MNAPRIRKNDASRQTWAWPDTVQPSYRAASSAGDASACLHVAEGLVPYAVRSVEPQKVVLTQPHVAQAMAGYIHETRVLSFFAASLDATVERLVEKKFAELVERSGLVPGGGLAGARARGRAYQQAELGKPGNASLQAASRYAGVSERTVNKWRNEGSLYALLQEGKARGYRYPLWQFDANRERLAKVLAQFRDTDASAWVIHNFFERPNSSLGDRTPHDWVLDPAADIEQLVNVAQQRFAGDQGAS